MSRRVDRSRHDASALLVQYTALMNDDAVSLALAIGARLREQRHAREWTLDRLADVSGVSRRMLVSLEQGAANPSLAVLLRLSEALGIALPVLVEPPKSGSVSVTMAGDGPVLWRGTAGGEARMVAGLAMPDAFELWWWALGPGDHRDSAPHSRGTRELIHVHRGVLMMTLGGERVELHSGDAVAFSGDVEHSYRNDGEHVVEFSGAVFEPAGGR
jgi:transcriptional regulator with XRE-family HTH domain